MPFLERARMRPIASLALPIIGGMISQTLLNLVDTAMVGTLGDEAIAAVGLGGFTNFLSQSIVLGLGTGVQAMAARRMGEGRMGETAMPLNGGLVLVVLIAVPLSTVMFLAAPMLFPLLHADPEVQRLGTEYLQSRLVGMVFVGMNYCFRGYWNGVSLSKLYMRTLIVMHSSNVVISYILIFGALGNTPLGSLGAGIGTTASTILGTMYYISLGMRHARSGGFLTHRADGATMRTILRLSIPNGLQQLLFSAGFTALFWIIGLIDGAGQAANVAAANVLINIMLFAILPGLGLGLAANSLVGQALGRGDAEDARNWGWDVVKVGAILMGLAGIPMVLIPEILLGVFLHNPDTLALAAPPLQVFGMAVAFDAGGMVLMQALLGAGASRTVLLVTTIFQWGLFLPAAYVIGPVLGFGLFGIWMAQIAYRTLQAFFLAFVWERRGWAEIKV